MRAINNYIRDRRYTPHQVSLGLIVLTTLIYILIFIPLFRMIALSVIVLAIVPIIITGGTFGWWGGLFAGLVALLVNYSLFFLIHGNQPSLIYDPLFWIAHTVFIIVGVGVGYLQNILVALRQELNLRTLAENKLNYLTTHDPLTDLANQSLFYDRLSHAISRAERNKQELAILYMDIDRFKLVNDAHGHDDGDKVLLELAKRMRRSVRASDTVARLGADEFAIILENITSDEDITMVSKKIMAVVAEEIPLKEQAVQLTISLGISRYPKNGKSANNLIREADIAMTDAKKGGGNRFVFSSLNLEGNGRSKPAMD